MRTVGRFGGSYLDWTSCTIGVGYILCWWVVQRNCQPPQVPHRPIRGIKRGQDRRGYIWKLWDFKKVWWVELADIDREPERNPCILHSKATNEIYSRERTDMMLLRRDEASSFFRRKFRGALMHETHRQERLTKRQRMVIATIFIFQIEALGVAHWCCRRRPSDSDWEGANMT